MSKDKDRSAGSLERHDWTPIPEAHGSAEGNTLFLGAGWSGRYDRESDDGITLSYDGDGGGDE
jgi:hypothetical protein